MILTEGILIDQICKLKEELKELEQENQILREELEDARKQNE